MPAVAFENHGAVIFALHELDFFPKLLARIVDVGFEFLENHRMLCQQIQWRHGKRPALSMPVKSSAVFIGVLAQIENAGRIACRDVRMNVSSLCRLVRDAKQHAVRKADETGLLENRL